MNGKTQSSGMRFVVAIDGSEESDRALEHAAELVDVEGDAVTLAHVVNPDVYADTASQPLSDLSDADDRIVATVETAEDRGERVLDEAQSYATELGLDADTVLLYGTPAMEVATYAEKEEYDGVFVGHRGKSERVERVLGSVAKDLVELATCPVTVVR